MLLIMKDLSNKRRMHIGDLTNVGYTIFFTKEDLHVGHIRFVCLTIYHNNNHFPIKKCLGKYSF